MRANRKLWAAATICLTAVVGLTGCGKGDDKPADPFAGLSADAIADKAVAATKAATSVHMKGKIKNDGQDMAIDFSVDDKGTCQGTMGVGAEGKAEVMRTGGFTYLKGDEAFFKTAGDEDGSSPEESAALATLLNGRWMKMPADEADSNDLGEFCDLKTLFADMDKDTETKGLTREADADVDGTPAVVLKSKANEKGEVDTVYVAKDSAKPYILRTVSTGGDEPGEMTLSDYDKPLNVTPPPADQVMDMEALMKAGAGS
ncbi:hypothetical protein AB0E83_22955 [Streptomyces sp. NPDC035033]|uniref:hypothetical protein n=1 Tax=Streptomyces sp. NPDC035033 TaxID=3155368 RepID=UPI0033D7B159